MRPGSDRPADVPPVAAAVFAGQLDLARRYVDLLATTGIERGLLGPREADRLWDRHLLNCAVLTELLPDGARVVDVGSGAGLPGLVLAIRRPDLRVDLVESLQRRAQFLDEALAALDLESRVRVVRGRAEDATVVAEVGDSQWVTARAVAPLDRLVGWCLPLLLPGGRLLAVKGARAASELDEHRVAVARLGGRDASVVACGVGIVAPPVAVVVVQRDGPSRSGSRPDSRPGRRPAGRSMQSDRSTGSTRSQTARAKGKR